MFYRSQTVKALRAEIAELRDQLLTVSIEKARLQGELDVLRPHIVELKQMRDRAVDNIAFMAGVTPLTTTPPEPLKPQEAVTYDAGNVSTFLAQAQKDADEAFSRFQKEKLQRLADQRKQEEQAETNPEEAA